MHGRHPFQQGGGGPGKSQKKLQKEGPGTFWFDKEGAEGFLCLAGGQGVLGPFL